MAKNWVQREGESAPSELAEWAEKLEISQTLIDILWLRGLNSPEAMQQYLSPGLKYLEPFHKWPGLEESAAVLAEALLAGKKMAVWGDYDVDGVTSSAVVTQLVEEHGYDIIQHIPNRMEEGYGLNEAWIERLAEQGVELLLTVDCGITDFAPIAKAREFGMTVVVSDHHLPADTLPDAHAVCNPKVGECPCPHLAGVGVAFFLMCALNVKLAEATGKKADVKELLDLVALGTIADVVSLSGQNRVLVKNGLLKIKEARRPGLAALKEVSGYAAGGTVEAGQVAFGLAPRINAAGRMGKADIALEMLLTKDYERSRQLARELDVMNEERKNEEERILDEAMKQAEAQSDKMGLVLYGEDWHSGVIGIVASRVVEKFYKPTLILCSDGEKIKGSGRSISEFHLHEGLCRCKDLLLGFGGHKLAAGMSLEKEKLQELATRFNDIVIDAVGDKPLTATLKFDSPMGFNLAADFTLLKELEMLQPFGMGNSEPVFKSPVLLLKSRRVFARKHLKLELLDLDSGITLHAKAWRMVDDIPPSMEGRKLKLAYSPRIDRYNGSASVDLKIKDWEFLP
ncbi:single-stranded-DNA-specific exonuclease RecJ [Halodesulfovibrio marinisediminis]|uniref:Single-stranded-DNA-specific exonuclease RecJ n=1 Tax=Halodesulfovibrio marinisediminis DSM 17456 TaxID=1121457 RepID=A0A1N6IUV5_9BACT|nr:single-stranded-DNA-specific exonuclease RecJ [Halodesulfovibrio marinisediminis]SIO35812.1 exonuclease RecJ [Halodesulfovibrio marinisediminis DSM 17456]